MAAKAASSHSSASDSCPHNNTSDSVLPNSLSTLPFPLSSAPSFASSFSLFSSSSPFFKQNLGMVVLMEALKLSTEIMKGQSIFFYVIVVPLIANAQ